MAVLKISDLPSAISISGSDIFAIMLDPGSATPTTSKVSIATFVQYMGLGTAATKNVGTTAGTVAAGDDSRITGAAQKSSNLSDLQSASTARTNLNLGSLATVTPTGTPDGTKFLRDDNAWTTIADAVTVSSSAPVSPNEGDLWCDSDDGTLYCYYGATPTWVAVGGSLATNSLWDAKGDLVVGTGANTASKLTVGTDGYVLTADTNEATGLKWSAVSGGASVTVSATAPISPNEGDLWYDSDTGSLFMYYGATPTWVEVGGGGSGSGAIVSATAPDSPNEGDLWCDSDDGTLYCYYGATPAWNAVAANTSQETYVTSVLTDRPTLFYPCSDYVTTMWDDSRHAQHGSWNGSPTSVVCPVNGVPHGMTVDQTHYGNTTNGSGQYPGSAVTVEFLAKVTSTNANNASLIARQNTSDGWNTCSWGVGVWTSAGTISFLAQWFSGGGGGAIRSMSAPATIADDGLWHHFVVTMGSGSTEAYIDGVLKNQTNGLTGGVNDGSYALMIGRDGNSVNGGTNLVAGVAIYNGMKLSSTRIAAHYTASGL